MDTKEVVAAAKRYVTDLMSDEAVEPPTLEEVWLDEELGLWRITLGIRRKPGPDSAAGRLGVRSLPDYKTVTIADVDGRIVSLRNHALAGLPS